VLQRGLPHVLRVLRLLVRLRRGRRQGLRRGRQQGLLLEQPPVFPVRCQ
jgi:hypothetical protein